ncbi:hypothetical protein [Chitinophaga pinensis]|uniref:Uncharacterized protein n=1 Tax=Chitinophaga pinensis TaxID=79329 RepID=A0A5C6LQ60_9BACT|nr:hypothetical protein [Chitinophaga pinensis]TWV99450.1 hypothetical protein FEF09_17085 [Chitinophaga pinensis]
MIQCDKWCGRRAVNSIAWISNNGTILTSKQFAVRKDTLVAEENADGHYGDMGLVIAQKTY